MTATDAPCATRFLDPATMEIGGTGLVNCPRVAYVSVFEFRPNELALPRGERACLTTFSQNLEPTGRVSARPLDAIYKEAHHG